MCRVCSVPGAILISLSIVSIDVGVFGFLALWGVNIDSISSVSILMSVGFAVDLVPAPSSLLGLRIG